MKSRIEVKKMIEEDSIRVIEYLENLLNQESENSNLNSIIVIKRNLKDLEKLYRTGTISYEDYRRGLNQINLNILKIIDNLNDRHFKSDQTVVEPPKQNGIEITVSDLIRELGELEIRESMYDDPVIKGYVNTKRLIIAVQALRLIEKNRLSMSSVEYTMLAYSFFRSADNTKAEQIYRKAIENIDEFSDSVQGKIYAIRGYSNFLYNTNRSEDGAKQLESAILEGNGETENVTNGHTYQLRFSNECDIQNFNEAVESYRKAKDYFMKIGNNTVRNYNLSGLENAWNVKTIPSTYSRP